MARTVCDKIIAIGLKFEKKSDKHVIHIAQNRTYDKIK